MATKTKVKKPRILVWDLEICCTLNEYLLERLYSGFLRPGMLMSGNLSHMLMIGYKWLGEKKTYCKRIDEFPSFKKDPTDDRELVKFSQQLVSSADHLVAHYGDKFDRKFLNTRILIHKLPQIPPATILKQTDTCSIAKQFFKIDSNRLDVIAKALKLDPKMKKEWPGWWLRSLKGDVKAIKEMAHYCIQDVNTLEQVYNELKSYSIKIPNHQEFHGEGTCVGCGSVNVIKDGFRTTRSGVYARLRCKDCGRCQSSSKAIKTFNVT